jgi:hypothetical protein
MLAFLGIAYGKYSFSPLAWRHNTEVWNHVNAQGVKESKELMKACFVLFVFMHRSKGGVVPV